MNLETLIDKDAWSEGIDQSLDQFHQGHLIRNIPLFYAGSLNAPVTKATKKVADAMQRAGSDIAGLQVISLPKTKRYPYAVITSATCDIAEAGTSRNPFIQVAPVFNIGPNIDNGAANMIRAGRYGDFVYLTKQPRPVGCWVVDLRVFFPVEKGVLHDRQPIDGFASEADRLRFARRLGKRVMRPALADVVHTHVVAELDRWIKEDEREAVRSRPKVLRGGLARFADVKRIALRFQGDRLAPEWVQVVVFQDTALSPTDKLHWRNWRSRTEKKLRRHGIRLQPVAFTSLADMSVAEYEGLVEVVVTGLGHETYY
ncbi:hypothetical protein ACFV6E_32690 [Streptomyces sp. NPDC059785]|uniref:hypothetical protein n=1 Tax=Streptomyces sp. NPDC059785 TaxID=3346945 RepID=UPI003663ED3D